MLEFNILPDKQTHVRIREVEYADLPLLVELEKVWPETARASEAMLKWRIDKFKAGYFVVENEVDLIGSILSCPYDYQPQDLRNFKNWETVMHAGYEEAQTSQGNALYIVSGTSKASHLFGLAVRHVAEFAKTLGKKYVVAGCVLPGYLKYIELHGEISAADYVFLQNKNRFVDPFIEKYSRQGYLVPDKNHVFANYFTDTNSLHHAALVVKNLMDHD